MPRVKVWTSEDRARALEWIERKAKTGTVFRQQSGSVASELEALACIADPNELAEHLQETLTTEAWRRLLDALRQRKRAESDQGGKSDDCESAIRAFHEAVNGLDTALARLVKTGAIVAMRERAIMEAARGRRSFGPDCGTTIEVDHVLRVECEPATSELEPVQSDETIHVREGAVRLRVELEPVKDVRRHLGGGGLSASEPELDTWDNCAARIMAYAERYRREQAECVIRP